jgi:hypothetical protein
VERTYRDPICLERPKAAENHKVFSQECNRIYRDVSMCAFIVSTFFWRLSNKNLSDLIIRTNTLWKILGSHGEIYEDYFLLVCDDL